jgi:O-antigen ligase
VRRWPETGKRDGQLHRSVKLNDESKAMTKKSFENFLVGGECIAGGSMKRAFAEGPSVLSGLGRKLDLVIVLGLLVLAVFVLRTPDVRTAWRVILLALGVVSIGTCLVWRPVAWRELLPEVRYLLLVGVGLVALVVTASLLGQTFPVAQEQFLRGFLLPLLLPWLILNHIRDERRWRLLVWAFVVAALLLVLRNFHQYIDEWRVLGRLSTDIHLHRRYAINLVFGLPFLLWVAVSGKRCWLSAVAWLLSLLTLVMIVATGARGAWVGAAAVLLVFLLLLRRRRLLLASVGIAAIAAIIGAMVVPPDLVLDRLRQGLDTSSRTSGTWGPALEIMESRPWLGYGFGDEVFNYEFNRRSATAEHWTFKQSAGAHNFFLTLGVAAGLPAMLLLVGVIISGVVLVWARVLRGSAASGADAFSGSGVALVAAVCGTYMMIGNVENLQWNLLAYWFGMALTWLQLDGRHQRTA